MMLGMAFGGAGGLLSGAGMLKMGMMAASAVGMYLLNGNKEKGEIGKLDDLKVSSSTYGRGIALVYGTMRVSGNMFWATDFEEVMRLIGPKGKDVSGKKKGDKKGQPYYSYFANFAMALCEGPVEELLRIWADSNLIYDKHNPKNEDLVGPGFSRNESGGGKAGMGATEKKGGAGGTSGRFSFRYYSGSESQMPDRFMLSKQEEWEVPAHRGLCYLFFEHFALEDFGNRIPTITAEVAVRKKREVHFNTFENMGPADSSTILPGIALSFVDYERYKFYFEEHSSARNSRVLRVYDLSGRREVNRIYADDINIANEWEVGGAHYFRGFVGVAGNGDIIIQTTTGNSAAIAFLDPNTLAAKRTFGYRSSTLSNTSETIVSPSDATPASFIDVVADTSGEVETTPARCTIIQSLGGEYYVFSENHEPLAFFSLPQTGVATRLSPVIPIVATVHGGEFIITAQSPSGDTAYMWRVAWGMNTVERSLAHGGFAYDYDISRTGPASAQLIRKIGGAGANSPDGIRSAKIEAAQLMQGTEELIWLEWRRSNSPLVHGSYAMSVDAKRLSENRVATNDYDWEIKVTDDVMALANLSGMIQAPINISREISWYRSNTVYTVDFGNRDASYYTASSQFVSITADSFQVFWPQRNSILRLITDPNTGWRTWAMMVLDRNAQVPVDVHFIASDLADRVGIPPDKLNLTQLGTHEITGYLVENPTSARRVTEELAQVFMFDVAEIDYSLHFVSRGKEKVLTIPQKDLGVIDGDTMDYFSETRVQEIDLPQTVLVSYINAEKDYQTNSQHYRRPRSPMATMQSRDRLEINLAMAMEKDFAKQLAHKVTMSVWTERITYGVMLPWTYMQYDPTDVLEFRMDDGLTWQMRMMKMDLGANFSIEAEGVSQTPASYTSNATAQPDGGVLHEYKPMDPQTSPFIANIPFLQDADSIGNAQYSYYWGACAQTPGLRGAGLEGKMENDKWKSKSGTTIETVWGYALGVIPPPANGPFATDDKTVIRLIPGRDFSNPLGVQYEWASIPDSEWPSHDNTLIVGDEVIYFKNVTMLPTGAVEVSHLIRGARGTEEAAYRHVELEKFAIASSGLSKNDESFDFIKRTWHFRTISGFNLIGPVMVTKYLDGASHKPYAPHVRTRAMQGGNLRVSWLRRTRLGGAMVDGTGSIPLNEELERYEVYLLPEPYDPETFDPANEETFVRVWRERPQSYIDYTPAMMLEDGFDLKDPVYIVVYQISAAVGRGFPGYATLHPTILT